ncbi:MAG: hypothetical protein H0T56_05655, partial [Pseudaminobacter sp.]|nr:hypothetical protein [Pseudaminobacter sp.]
VEAAINRRKWLQAKITEIESEFQPAAPQVEQFAEPAARRDAAAAPEVSVAPQRDMADAPSVAAPESRAAPSAVEAPAISVAAERPDAPLAGLAGDRAVEVAPDRNEARARARRRPSAALFVAATVIAALGIGIWWASQTGMLKSAAERDTAVPNPPKTIESEDFVPEEEVPAFPSSQADPQRDWITVFSPADATDVNAPADTSAEVMQDDSGTFLRIRSGRSGSAIVFDVGQGVLERLAGKTATFDIVARTEEGKETQMSVDCNFGELGDCGRKRYAVGYERGDYLFEVGFPAGRPGAGGTIAINSDFDNQGRAVDIYEIRVSVAQ